MKKELIIGLILITLGLGIFVFYYQVERPKARASARAAMANELMVEGKLIFERGDRQAVNSAIDLFSKVIARYPDTPAATEAFYFIAQSYEKLGFNRLAYLKYMYILKEGSYIPKEMNGEIRTRIARLKIMKYHTEEGVHQLLSQLTLSDNRDFRSRIYTELGHTHLKEGRYGKALRMFHIALKENGSNEEAILGKARAFKRTGQDEKAFDMYEYFLKYYGNFSHYAKDTRSAYLKQLYSSALSAYHKGSYYRSVSLFKRLLRFFPGSSKSENALYWIGENYFTQKKYTQAASYFRRTLSNGYTHKDQDARIKRGYCYFMTKRFDLAAREFQVYLKTWPHGRHAETAKKWKETSTREILYRIKDRMAPEEEETTDDDSIDESTEESTNEVSDTVDGKIKFENVAEL